MWAAFIPNPNDLPDIDHINEDKLDYSIQNLTWASTSENMKSIKNTANKKQSVIHKTKFSNDSTPNT